LRLLVLLRLKLGDALFLLPFLCAPLCRHVAGGANGRCADKSNTGATYWSSH
jgi:hypothetical protein